MGKQGNALRLANPNTKYSQATGKRFCAEGLLWCKWDPTQQAQHASFSEWEQVE